MTIGAAMSQPLISVEKLSKSFRIAKRESGLWGAVRGVVRRQYYTIAALDEASFAVQPGELVGYIGPNGAGKSTTVKILSGILVPDSGDCKVLGKTPWLHRVETVQKIGVVFGQRTQLWWDLPVLESFELLREIYRITPQDYKKMLADLVDVLNLSKLLDVPVRQLSLGQRMRCELAAALLHSPRILFLDEPTIGLDAVSKLAVRDFIRGLNRKNEMTIMLTTHDMDDVETLCSRVIVIGDGRLLFDGKLIDLRAKVSSERRLIVDLVDPEDHVEDEKTKFISRDGGRVTLAFNPEKTSAADLIGRVTARSQVRDLFVENPPIEEIIAQLYADLGANALE